MQIITLEEVKKMAKQYYDAGKLTAQHPDPAKRLCKYQIDDCRCAIGAAMSDETLEKVKIAGKMEAAIDGILALDIISLDDVNAIYYIQAEHDLWCNNARIGFQDSDPIMAEEHRNKFLELIGG